VRLAERDLPQALLALNRVGLTPVRIFINTEGEGYREVGV
jgi:hypothetical protein